jgi:hypothetical protein
MWSLLCGGGDGSGGGGGSKSDASAKARRKKELVPLTTQRRHPELSDDCWTHSEGPLRLSDSSSSSSSRTKRILPFVTTVLEGVDGFVKLCVNQHAQREVLFRAVRKGDTNGGSDNGGGTTTGSAATEAETAAVTATVQHRRTGWTCSETRRCTGSGLAGTRPRWRPCAPRCPETACKRPRATPTTATKCHA